MPCKAAALTAQVDKKEKKDLPKAGFLFRHCRRTGMIMMAVVMPLSLLTDVCLEDWSTAVQLVQVMGRRWGLVSGKVVNNAFTTFPHNVHAAALLHACHGFFPFGGRMALSHDNSDWHHDG